MNTSTQGAARLAVRHIPNRELGFRWCLRTAGVTVDQRRKLPITIVVIVILTALAAHSHLALTADIRALAVNSDAAVVALNDFATRGAPAASHRSHRPGCSSVRDTHGVQELRSPQDSDTLPLSHARRRYPRRLDSDGLSGLSLIHI